MAGRAKHNLFGRLLPPLLAGLPLAVLGVRRGELLVASAVLRPRRRALRVWKWRVTLSNLVKCDTPQCTAFWGNQRLWQGS